MIRDRIEALVRELRTPDGRSRTHIGHAAARVEIADRLTQILAEEEGGWRPIEEAPHDQRPILAIHKDNKARIMHVTWRVAIGSEDYLQPRSGGTWRPTHFQFLPEPPPGARP